MQPQFKKIQRNGIPKLKQIQFMNPLNEGKQKTLAGYVFSQICILDDS